MSSAVIGRTMAGSVATRAATGLALLMLLANACTMNIDVDPSAGLDLGGETDNGVDELLQTVLKPDVSGADAGSTTGEAASAMPGEDPPGASPVIEVYPPPTATADPGETTATPADSAEASTTEIEDAGSTATAPATTATTTTAPNAGPSGEEEAPARSEDLPGEPYEYGPDAGVSLAVVGVDHDDVLNVRGVPFGEIIATLGLENPIAYLLEVREAPSGEPIAWYDSWTGTIVATGRTRKLPTTIWHEVQVADLTGWASGAYLAPIGLTDDITAHLIDRLGERPVAGTLTDLALIVGEAFASEEPPSRVVVTVGPSIFEALGEVTVDVLNLGDDSLLGYRLHVFATPGADDWMSDDPGPFTLRTVYRTVLCYSHRGVTADGLCM